MVLREPWDRERWWFKRRVTLPSGLCCIISSTWKERQCFPVNLQGIPQKKNCKKNEHALTSRNAKNLSIPISGTSFLVQNRDLINHATSPRATQSTKCCSKGISYMLIDWTEKNYPIGTLVIIFQKLPLGDTSQGTPLETEFKKAQLDSTKLFEKTLQHKYFLKNRNRSN